MAGFDSRQQAEAARIKADRDTKRERFNQILVALLQANGKLSLTPEDITSTEPRKWVMDVPANKILDAARLVHSRAEKLLDSIDPETPPE